MLLRSRVRITLLLGLPLLVALAPPAGAQPSSEVTLDTSPQLFTVLCAARAAGVIPAGREGDQAVVSRVENVLAKLDPAVTAPLREFFQAKQQEGAAVSLSGLISLGLLSGPPPDFVPAVPQASFPPDAYPLQDLLGLLPQFYARAELQQLWRQTGPLYEKAIRDWQGDVSLRLLETRGYLRMVGEVYPGRFYTIYLDWLAPPGLTAALNVGQDYFLVLHPQADDLLDAVRHQYLHFLLDPYAAKYVEKFSAWSKLQPIAERAPRLPVAFKQDTLLLATESLIQAIELRLGRLAPGEVGARLEEKERSGYLFVRHFYSALERFEQDEPSMRYYFPELATGYDPVLEALRLQSLEFAPALPEPEPPGAQAAPARTVLDEANAYLTEGNVEAARQRFQQVLAETNENEPAALYGMALVASMERDAGQAKQYFLRTLAHAREPSMLAWTNIYLGRIFDLEGEREQAVNHYQAALALNTLSEKIEQAARQGLRQPFGKEE